MDAQNIEHYVPRHAYRTADYRVSKRQMNALYRRYYVWAAGKERAFQVPSSSVYNIGRVQPGSRRAYQTTSYSYVSYVRPMLHSPMRFQRHAYQMYSGNKRRHEASSMHVTVS